MADALPRAHVAHRVPGRLRVRVPSRKGDRAFFEGTIANLRGRPSIRSVRASARTASITMEHDGDAHEIARLAREAGIFDLPEATVIQLLAERFEGRIVGVKPDSLVSVGLAGLGVYQAMRGQFLGSGVEHIWQAYGTARTVGRPDIAVAMALLGAVQMFRGRVLSPAASLFFYALMVRAANWTR